MSWSGRWGDTDLSGGKHIVKEFKEVAGVRLPLIPLPDLAEVRRRLLNAFPHAIGGHGRHPGRPSRPAACATPARSSCWDRPAAERARSRRLSWNAWEFRTKSFPAAVPPMDPSVARRVGGRRASRACRWRWSARTRCASPGIVLDELEKTGTSRHNGAVGDVLLGLFEPQTSSRWLDPYIQAAADLSHILWIATANTLEGIQVPLRDRSRILRFPDPGLEHLPIIATHLLRAQLIERGLDARWATPLTAVELKRSLRLGLADRSAPSRDS